MGIKFGDIKCGRRLHPFSSFSKRFAEATIWRLRVLKIEKMNSSIENLQVKELLRFLNIRRWSLLLTFCAGKTHVEFTYCNTWNFCHFLSFRRLVFFWKNFSWRSKSFFFCREIFYREQQKKHCVEVFSHFLLVF